MGFSPPLIPTTISSPNFKSTSNENITMKLVIYFFLFFPRGILVHYSKSLKSLPLSPRGPDQRNYLLRF